MYLGARGCDGESFSAPSIVLEQKTTLLGKTFSENQNPDRYMPIEGENLLLTPVGTVGVNKPDAFAIV